MKKLLIIICSLFLALNLQAEELSKKTDITETESISASSIRGKVIEEKSGESLIGVEVEIVGSGLTTYTDMDGKFEFSGLELQSEYAIRVKYISYKNKIIRGLNPGNENLLIKLQNHSISESSISLHNNPGA